MNKGIIPLSVAVIVVCMFLTTNAGADLKLTWVTSPYSNTGDDTTAVSWAKNSNLVIGNSTAEDDQQPMGIYGAGAALPTKYNDAGFQISFEWEFYTWDSYNAVTEAGTGYWDSFSATITKGDYYWNETLSDPITTDPDIEKIIKLEAGTKYGDGVLDAYKGQVIEFTFMPPDGDQYYLNLVIDTLTTPNNHGDHPSWGEFSDVKANPIPDAVLLGLIGLGVVGWKLRKYA